MKTLSESTKSELASAASLTFISLKNEHHLLSYPLEPRYQFLLRQDKWSTIQRQSPLLQPVNVGFSPSADLWDDDFLLEEEGHYRQGDSYFFNSAFPNLELNHTSLPTIENGRNGNRTRMDLPVKINGTTLDSRPDSGCEENMISSRIAFQLGLLVDRSPEHRKNFRVANGALAQASGIISTLGFFPNEERHGEMAMTFYVLPQLITPLIMGMRFLDETGSLAKNRHRLRPRIIESPGRYQISRMDRPSKWLRCMAGDQPILASPDTGSDIDLISLAYAKERGFHVEDVHDEDSIVEFADGSTARLAGRVRISFEVCSNKGRIAVDEMFFYVLENLTCHLLIGEEFLQANEIFQKYDSAITEQYSRYNGIDSPMNTIYWQRSIESTVSRIGSLFSGKKRESVNEEMAPRPTHIDDDAMALWERQQNNEAAENHELDRFTQRIMGMQDSVSSHDSPPSSPFEFQRELPSLNKDANYQKTSQQPDGPQYSSAADYSSSNTETPSTYTSGTTPESERLSIVEIIFAQTGRFECTFPDCNAQPFQTQYLLNAHANVHSSNIPHFCSVKGCPRGPGGKGFKRKKEMLRHGLLHDLPGYVCPFCPEQRHKYTRPDNLYRHVRVHHVDITKDHPQLMDILSQRPEAPSRGRRRREGNP